MLISEEPEKLGAFKAYFKVVEAVEVVEKALGGHSGSPDVFRAVFNPVFQDGLVQESKEEVATKPGAGLGRGSGILGVTGTFEGAGYGTGGVVGFANLVFAE